MTGRDLLVLARQRWYVVALWCAAATIAAATTSYHVWAAFWILPVLAALTLPLARRLDLGTGWPSGPMVVAGGFVVKVGVGTLARFAMVHGWYDGDSDATRYDRVGSSLYEAFRRLDYRGLDGVVGSGFVDALTGQVYAITGWSRLGGFLVFSWLGFVGMWCCVRAVQIALPDADARRYAIVLFAWPSMWFWPSSMGKDAPVVLGFGLTLFGFAKLLDGRRSGLIPAAGGVALITVIRPQLIFLIGAALLIALAVFAGRPGTSSVTGRPPSVAYRSMLVVGVVIALAVAVPVTGERFGSGEFGFETARALLDQVESRTNAGDSRFDAPDPETLLGYPAAAATVLFRPIPFEARRLQELLASIDGVLLLALGIRFRHSLVSALRRSPREAFLAFCLSYLAVFFFTFGRFESFALLSRQRTQIIPILIVLLSLRRRSVETAPNDSASTDGRAGRLEDAGPPPPIESSP